MDSYFPAWMTRQQELLGELVSAPRHPSDSHVAAHRDLAGRVLDHYHDYYQEKARVASFDVLPLFSPSWLTPLESTFLWVAGWKPSLAFRLLSSTGISDRLSTDQSRAVDELRRGTFVEERGLGEQLVRVQEAVAMPQVLRLVRGPRNPDSRSEVVNPLLVSMEQLVTSADALRARTISKLVEILTPVQTLDFLAAAAELHLRVRDYGFRRPSYSY